MPKKIYKFYNHQTRKMKPIPKPVKIIHMPLEEWLSEARGGTQKAVIESIIRKLQENGNKRADKGHRGIPKT